MSEHDQGKKEPAYRELHRVADAAEPRMARAFLRSVMKMRSRLVINDLSVVLSTGSVRTVGRFLDERTQLKDSLQPVAKISSDLHARGFNLGKRIYNDEIGETIQ